MNKFIPPFFREINKRSNSFKIEQKIQNLTNSYCLTYCTFICLLPWMLLFSLFEYIVGFFNRIRIKPNTKYKYNLAVVAIAKNESEYIAEWLAFNIASGVDHFFIYDNDSTDEMPQILQRFTEKGYVTYNVIHGEVQQSNAYNDALRKYGNLCKYMAFIDCDEYLQTVESNRSIVNEIDRLLDGKNAKAGVAVNWVMYGSSHLESKPVGYCFESFKWRAKLGKKGTYVIKSIVRPECVISYNHPHIPQYIIGFYSVNTIGVRCDDWSNEIDDYYSLRLNHYFTKSKEQWIKRRSARRADTGTIRTLDEFYEHDNNDVEDLSPLRFSTEVRLILKDVMG